MKRVVLQIESAERSADAGSIPEDAAGQGAAAGGEPPLVHGPVRIEAELTEVQVQAIIDGLLNLPGSNHTNLLVADLVRAELREAGPEACDLYERIVVKVEREVVSRVYAECDYTQTLAADRLGINRNTLHKKLLQFHLLADAAPDNKGTTSKRDPA